jgi:23S rRNA pseudouridine1911/1915/1917 synthase
MNQGWTYRNQVQPADAGLTLLAFYSQRYPHSSEPVWRDRILTGQVQVEGQPRSPDWVLQPGQRLVYHRSPWVEPTVPLAFTVLYSDDDLWVVDKPAGLPVLPGGGFVEHTLLHQLRQRYPQTTPVPIHRLGRGTSGLVLLGRSPLGKSALSQQMRASTAGQPSPMKKTYRALIGPSTLPDRFTLTTPIGKVPHPTLSYVYGAHSQGKPARSEGQVVERGRDCTWVAVTIPTGRPHQIRVHLAAAGYPLLGDPLYTVGGVPELSQSGTALPDTEAPQLARPGDGGYHLHAHHLTLAHPRTGDILAFTAPLPPPLRTCHEF